LHFPSTGGADSMDATSGVWALCWNGDGQLFAGTRKDGIVSAGRSWKWTTPEVKQPEAAEAKAEPAAAEGAPAAAAEKPAEEPATPAEPPAAEAKPAEPAAADAAAEKKE
jgi:pyruvate/2-oxoglutarate dehydrogenase complex dihydrolipoamide acyltransferase (E2) component